MENPKMLYTNSLDYLARVYCIHCWFDHWVDVIADTDRPNDYEDDKLLLTFDSKEKNSDNIFTRAIEAYQGFPYYLDVFGEVFIDLHQVDDLLELFKRVENLDSNKKVKLPFPKHEDKHSQSQLMASRKEFANTIDEKVILDVSIWRLEDDRLQLLDMSIGWQYTKFPPKLGWKHIFKPNFLSDNTVGLEQLPSEELIGTLKLISENVKTHDNGLTEIINKDEVFDVPWM